MNEHNNTDLTAVVEPDRFGPGPWVGEPDRVEWRYRGLPCLMIRNARFGNWCGYVGVPPGHPWHGASYGDLTDPYPDVHGGLTYSDKCDGHVCHVPQPGESDDVWWVGFDCGHYDDLQPGIRQYFEPFPGSTYKDVAYVRAECENLADQVIAAEGK